jgi:lia operon protein LiaG
MDSIGIKRALIKGGLLAMAMVIGTGSLFGIEIDDEKRIDLASVDGIRILMSSAAVRVIESESKSEARLHLYGKALQRVSLGLETKQGIAQARIKRPWTLPLPEKLRLDIYLPAGYGKDFELRATSGKIRAGYFEFAALSLETSSGGIEWEGAKAETIAVKATSGNVKIGKAEAKRVTLVSTSGSIAIGECDSLDASLRASSGKIAIDSLAGNIETRSSSGDIAISYPEYRAWNAMLKASSGKIAIGLPPEARFALRTKSGSGKIVSDFGDDPAAAGNISVTTSSGRIEVRKN